MLKDDYETLLRRGMPEHPRLHFGKPMVFPDDNPRALARAAADWHNSDNGSFVEESDARDLLAMHALRWLYGMKDARLREKYIDDWSTRLGSGQHRCAPDDTIAAVLCATRDLEPKDPLDAFIERHAC